MSILPWAAFFLGCGSGIHNAAPGASAPPTVSSHALTNLVITHGGTYSGSWTSNDPAVPAVDVETDEPVLMENSSVTGRSDLIRITGIAGAHVTIQHVTATGLDPQVPGQQRGAFVHATGVASLTVERCSITGTRDGIVVDASQPSLVVVRNNSAANLEDRVSDGAGGFGTARPSLGNFVLLSTVNTIQGAEIGWNQVVQIMGQSSMENGVRLYKSQGSAANAIVVHDNYFEGASSPATGAYSGNGIIADGDSTQLVSAYAVFENNQVVHTAGGGIMIANGHDITARGNRVVSCGQNADGSWYARKQVTAISLWNFYQAPAFFNNVITDTAGGMVVPDAEGKPTVSDQYASASDVAQGNSISGNRFTDPCMLGSLPGQLAEDAERSLWTQKLQTSGNVPGDAAP